MAKKISEYVTSLPAYAQVGLLAFAIVAISCVIYYFLLSANGTIEGSVPESSRVSIPESSRVSIPETSLIERLGASRESRRVSEYRSPLGNPGGVPRVHHRDTDDTDAKITADLIRESRRGQH
jgi:hypothetical protein